MNSAKKLRKPWRDTACRKLRLKRRAKAITDSFNEVIQGVDVEMFRQCMEQIDLIEKQQAACLNHLEELANKYFAEEISLC